MSCKADVQFNFSRASEHDDFVYGAARPGAAGQRCFNPEDKVTVAEGGHTAAPPRRIDRARGASSPAQQQAPGGWLPVPLPSICGSCG
ncbi:hypothetical protein TSOC_013213 [Tetrabaena socialis]|uniref:Uncharacterized protein n=1 Tax=Tetrabaena socialis TaxID=47790 RepID=A0A2J7ZKZ3_9CHLO|nr:hypothetical protein TSOC_013213 [Tetrabaena socialis]|eukprot:PNH00932.1 hypothetical protein TSOC_013213 [Tetrabaena socialis]